MFSTKSLYTAPVRRGPRRNAAHRNDRAHRGLLISSSSTAVRSALVRYPRRLAHLFRRVSTPSARRLIAFLLCCATFLLAASVLRHHFSAPHLPTDDGDEEMFFSRRGVYTASPNTSPIPPLGPGLSLSHTLEPPFSNAPSSSLPSPSPVHPPESALHSPVHVHVHVRASTSANAADAANAANSADPSGATAGAAETAASSQPRHPPSLHGRSRGRRRANRQASRHRENARRQQHAASPRVAAARKHATHLLHTARPLGEVPTTRFINATFTRALHARHGAPTFELASFCYDPARGRVLLPSGVAPPKTRGSTSVSVSTADLFEQVASYPTKRPAVWVRGTTVLWLGHAPGAESLHTLGVLSALHAALHAASSLVTDDAEGAGDYNMGHSSLPASVGKPTLAAARLLPAGPRAAEWQHLFLRDVVSSHLLDLSLLRPALVCFDAGAVLTSAHEGLAGAGARTAARAAVDARLPATCRDGAADRATVWVMSRGSGASMAGDIGNVAGVTTAVNHAVLAAGLAGRVRVGVRQMANRVCGQGTVAGGCRSAECSGEGVATCRRHWSGEEEVRAVGRATFVVAAAGADDVLAMMPGGGVVVEVLPHGVLSGGDGDAVRAAGLAYFGVRNRANHWTERMLRERFGDVGASVDKCWADEECRHARLSRETVVETGALQMAVERALNTWRENCLGEGDTLLRR